MKTKLFFILAIIMGLVACKKDPVEPDNPNNPSKKPPVADFIASATTVYIDSAFATVNFTDKSTNNPEMWDWKFTGGSPSEAADQNPVVTYSAPGNYKVSLTVTNTSGSDTKEVDSYITVIDNRVRLYGTLTTISPCLGFNVESSFDPNLFAGFTANSSTFCNYEVFLPSKYLGKNLTLGFLVSVHWPDGSNPTFWITKGPLTLQQNNEINLVLNE